MESDQQSTYEGSPAIGFLSLPLEIRTEIYRNLWTGVSVTRVEQVDSQSEDAKGISFQLAGPANIRSTCKTCYIESSSLFYELVTLNLTSCASEICTGCDIETCTDQFDLVRDHVHRVAYSHRNTVGSSLVLKQIKSIFPNLQSLEVKMSHWFLQPGPSRVENLTHKNNLTIAASIDMFARYGERVAVQRMLHLRIAEGKSYQDEALIALQRVGRQRRGFAVYLQWDLKGVNFNGEYRDFVSDVPKVYMRY
jgi:hypothetical protein